MTMTLEHVKTSFGDVVFLELAKGLFGERYG